MKLSEASVAGMVVDEEQENYQSKITQPPPQLTKRFAKILTTTYRE